jgi:hypothetical protein
MTVGLLTKKLLRKKIHICSDSRAAVVALAKSTTETSLVWECLQVLGKLSELNKVALVWVPEYQGILAKEGAIEVPPNHFTAVPFIVGKKHIKNHLELKHQARWTACTGCLQTELPMRYPVSRRANELLAMSKWRLRAAVGLLTGHTSLRTHLYKLGHTERQECRLCGHDKEDSVHIVCDCPVLAYKRCRIWSSMFLKPEDLEKVTVSSLLSLLANTGLGLVS